MNLKGWLRITLFVNLYILKLVGGEGFTPLFSGASPTFGESGHNPLTYTRNMKEGRVNSYIYRYYKVLDAIRIKL